MGSADLIKATCRKVEETNFGTNDDWAKLPFFLVSLYSYFLVLVMTESRFISKGFVIVADGCGGKICY